MRISLNQAQLNSLFLGIMDNYESYGPVSKDRRVFYEKIESPESISLSRSKPIISLKKVLFPNRLDISLKRDRKIALIGLPNCDAWALSRLYDQLDGTDLLPNRNDIFVAVSECLQDDTCFCAEVGINTIAPADLFIREYKSGFEVYALSKKAEKIIKTIGVKSDTTPLDQSVFKKEGDPIDLNLLTKTIENKEKSIKFWQDISSACFGCGACSTVCPLCFCFRQDKLNEISGKTQTCLKWDSCFAKEFSEIQCHHDHRPSNSDRLYNWYHHKFVRSPRDSKDVLCTGCGRCIKACPANLNMKNIITSLLAKENSEKDNEKT